MSRLAWDKIGEHLYETGTDRGVVYPMDDDGTYKTGYAWNGLTAVTHTPSGAEATALYADNIKYLSLLSAEEFGFTIEAYTYPDEFAVCDGSASLASGVTIGQQKRKSFGFTHRTLIGNDVDGNDHGYKVHLIYGAQASPSEMAYNTVNDSPEAATMSWECTTVPVSVYGLKPTSIVTIDSTKIPAEALKAIEDKLYGTEDSDPTLPLPDELLSIINETLGLPLEVTVKAIDGETEKYGKQVSELQDNIVILDNGISGTLKYVEEFTGFSSAPDEQKGNFLALSFESENAERIETKVVNGVHLNYVDATNDKFCIYKISDNKNQKIEIKLTKGSESESVIYDLTNLELKEAGG